MECAIRVTQKLMESPVCMYIFGQTTDNKGIDLITISKNLRDNRYENIEQWYNDLMTMFNHSIDTNNEYEVIIANHFKRLVMKEMNNARCYKAWIKKCERIYEKLNETMLRSPNLDENFTDDRITPTPYELTELQSVLGVVNDPDQVAQISQILRQTGELDACTGTPTVNLMNVSSLSARRLRKYAISIGKLI